ncbi:hypothetical protein [Nocardioides sp.]|uniref:hypothetical protein n=1 Tax=Nocardioides sp. TaxID=35761 RepID=UPI002C273144|nr:hypothetical protein [Nocardioides sp.]HXH79065.1 hypothetical protein [Nocardioides sp.]
MRTAKPDGYQSWSGLVYGLIGGVLLVLGAPIVEDATRRSRSGSLGPDDAYTLGVALVASGLYFMVAGAVAFGIQLTKD